MTHTPSAPGAPAHADLDAGTITRSIRIAAPRSVVWEALTSPEHVVEWWGHPMKFPDGIRPGSVGVFEWSEGDFGVRIDRLDEWEAYGITWGFDEHPDEPTTQQVLFTLADDGDGTLVTVTESGFDRLDPDSRRARMDENTSGWNQVLDSLASYVTKLRG